LLRSLSVLAPLSLRFYGTEREWSRTGEGQEEDCRGTKEEQEEERVHNGTDPIVHLESKGWKLEVAQISGNDHAFIRLYLMSKVVTKEELEAGITGVTEK